MTQNVGKFVELLAEIAHLHRLIADIITDLPEGLPDEARAYVQRMCEYTCKGERFVLFHLPHNSTTLSSLLPHLAPHFTPSLWPLKGLCWKLSCAKLLFPNHKK